MWFSIKNSGVCHEGSIRVFRESVRSPIAETPIKKTRPDIHADPAGTYAYHEVIREVKDFLTRENPEEYVKNALRNLGYTVHKDGTFD